MKIIKFPILLALALTLYSSGALPMSPRPAEMVGTRSSGPTVEEMWSDVDFTHTSSINEDGYPDWLILDQPTISNNE